MDKLKLSFEKHKPAYIIIGVIILLFVFSVITNTTSNNDNKNDTYSVTEQTEIPKYAMTIKVKSVTNLIFSTYDIKVYIDNQEQGTIKNGEFDEYQLSLEKGNHTLSVYNANDESVKGELSFYVNKEDNLQFEIHSRSDDISIETSDYEEETTEDVTEENTDKEITEDVTEETNEKETTSESTKLDNSVNYSTNDKDTVENGDSGVYAYKSKSGSYDVYWIIDFDNDCVYYFTEGNYEEETCDRVKITSGTLNDRVTITWNMDGEKTDWHLYFKYKNIPTTLVVTDHLGISTEFWTTNLDDALLKKSKRTINEY